MSFKKALRDLINTYSKENASDTPDFILAEYMSACLIAYEEAVCRRGILSGREERLRQALALACSMVLGGEQMSDAAQTMINDALGVENIEEPMRDD